MIRSEEMRANDELRQLLLAVREGDQMAFVRLYERYLPLINRLVTQFSPNLACAEDAADLRQEAALALYQAAMAYRLDQDEVAFGLFAKVCITNRMIDKLRVLDRYEKNEVFSEEDGAADPYMAADPPRICLTKRRFDRSKHASTVIYRPTNGTSSNSIYQDIRRGKLRR